MRRISCSLVFLTIVLFTLSPGQVSVTINGSATQGVMTSGDTVAWVITCPVGATVTNQLVVDADSNGRVDPGIDRAIFIFAQTDGQSGTDGPGDDDGTANGVISTSFKAGLAPAYWLFISSHNGASDTVSLRVLPLTSPSAFINGTVHVPSGVDAANILIEASPDSGSGMYFWHGLTNQAGQYSIQLGDDPVSHNPWRVRIGMEPSTLNGLVESPKRDTSVSVGPSAAIVDFNLVFGTVLTGVVKDDANNPIQGAWPHTHDPAQSENGNNYGTETNAEGVYYLAVPSGSYLLHFTADGYKDEWYNGQPSTSTATTLVVTNQDTIRNLNGTLVKAGLIRGVVTSGGSPLRASVALYVASGFEQQSTGTHEDGSYAFTVDQGSYLVRFDYNGEIRWYRNTTSMALAEALTITGTETIENVNIDFAQAPTSVGNTDGHPGSFFLGQNYPNPFNPSTEIRFQIPDGRQVRLSVVDLLGREIAVLVNGELTAGEHVASWDATGRASGMYFYRLEATSPEGRKLSEMKKMVLLK